MKSAHEMTPKTKGNKGIAFADSARAKFEASRVAAVKHGISLLASERRGRYWLLHTAGCDVTEELVADILAVNGASLHRRKPL